VAELGWAGLGGEGSLGDQIIGQCFRSTPASARHQPTANHDHRYHNRIALSRYHRVERACDATKDWRECPECLPKRDDPQRCADKLWRGLNSYNFYPLLSKDVPRHARCEACEG